MGQKFAGMGRDGSKTVWGWVGIEMKNCGNRKGWV